jgi:hypothetical protein
MSHPSLAAIAVPAGQPACLGAAPALTGKRRGNPDLGLAARCGARTRGGCPCRAPAIRGKLRCRMHGGRSTGPGTAEGMARLRAARTVHGAYSAATRARNRYGLTALRRGQVGNAAVRCVDRLPADLVGRLMQMAPELMPPPCPSGGLTPAEDRAVLRAEADALAPWRAAIAQARQAGWAGRGGPAAVVGRPGASAEAHAPVLLHGDPAAARDAAGSVHPDGAAKAHAPERARAAGSTALAAPPAAPVAGPAKAHAPERAADGLGVVPAAAAATHGGPMQQQAKAHAPERAADRGGAIPAAAPAAHGGPMQQQAKAHAPERGPAASDAIPAALPNRAARRRWKSLQRRTHPAPAACSHP